MKREHLDSDLTTATLSVVSFILIISFQLAYSKKNKPNKTAYRECFNFFLFVYVSG